MITGNLPGDENIDGIPLPAEAPLEDLLMGAGDDVLGEEPQIDPMTQNIAELMEEGDLSTLGSELLSLIEADIASRKPWEKAAARGVMALGLLTDAGAASDEGGTEEEDQNARAPWQSRVVHPVIVEAIIRFVATASKELFPPEGPAKPHVIGQVESEELQQQADRQAKYINYCYTSDEAIPDAGDEFEKLLFAAANDGDVFREPYWDAALGIPDVATISASDLIMPYAARSVFRSPRVTQRMCRTIGEVRAWQDAGYFRPLELTVGSSASADGAQAEKDRIIGKTKGADLSDDAAEITLYKITVNRTIEADPNAGGSDAAYLIWLTEDGDVLAIYPDWEPGKPQTQRKWRYANFPFLLMSGCAYGIGLYHVIGYLGETATDCLRALLDAAKLNNQPANFVSAEIDLSKIKDKGPLAPGELRGLPYGGGEFRSSLHTINFGAPSPVLFQLLTQIVEAAQRVASTADMMVGDAKNTGPVGTTVALIEQGSMVYNAIHARMHRSLRREMRLLARVIYDHIPDDLVYPYQVVETGEAIPIRPDFDGRVDVEPISDPRIFSKTQRIARGQAVLQLAQTAPQLYDLRELHERMLRALEEDGIEELLPLPEKAQRMDAMSENMALLNGKPIAVFADQDHKAHAQIHAAVKTDPRFIALFSTLPPEMQAQTQARMIEHEAAHLAWDYKIGLIGDIALMTGQQPQAIPGLVDAPSFTQPDEDGPPPMHPPEVERMLDQLAAAATAVQQAQQRQMALAQQITDAAVAVGQNGGAPGQSIQ